MQIPHRGGDALVVHLQSPGGFLSEPALYLANLLKGLIVRIGRFLGYIAHAFAFGRRVFCSQSLVPFTDSPAPRRASLSWQSPLIRFTLER